jgi:hypothetical protein
MQNGNQAICYLQKQHKTEVYRKLRRKENNTLIDTNQIKAYELYYFKIEFRKLKIISYKMTHHLDK